MITGELAIIVENTKELALETTLQAVQSIMTAYASDIADIKTNTNDNATETTLALIKAKTDNLDVALSTRTKPADIQNITGNVTETNSATILSNSTTLNAYIEAQIARNATIVRTKYTILNGTLSIAVVSQDVYGFSVTNPNSQTAWLYFTDTSGGTTSIVYPVPANSCFYVPKQIAKLLTACTLVSVNRQADRGSAATFANDIYIELFT